MFITLNVLEDFVAYFEKLVREEQKLIAKLDKAREEDALSVFLRSYGVDLQIAAVHGSLARDFLRNIEKRYDAREDKETIYNDLIKAVDHRVRNMSLNLNSSSISANIDQDAQNKFFLEIFRNLN